MDPELKAPFPYFGGKSKIAEQVWTLLGDVKNYVEPFAGSAAVLLARPRFKGPETLNDFSCFVVNTWRAIRDNPNDLARMLVGPVCEVNTEAEHAALMRSGDGLRDRLGDPTYSDTTLAAYWIRGANEWIGSGWAGGEGPWSWSRESGWRKRDRKLPHLGNAGKGINRQLPHLGDAGTGINRQLPHLGDAGKGQYEQRVEWVSAWLCALRDRLCEVRIACGDFERVLGDSSTTKHGLTGVFLDPPYDGTEYVYGTKVPVSKRVFDWCVAKTANPLLRIILAGRGTEHDALLQHGWSKSVWTANRGYSKDTDKGRTEEALWYSPSCVAANGADTDLL
jgi:hypothetical protein